MNRYIVIAEDYPNPGALARRLEVREQHMSDVRKGVDAGRIELGGGLLSKDFRDIDPETSPVYSLCGSCFVVQGESLDEVRARVLDDEYARASAWDTSSIKIYPFLPAFIKPQAQTPTMKEQQEAVTRRTPYGVSPRRAKMIARNEVFINDPRSTGAALNKQDRDSLGHSLSALRKGGTVQRKATLDNLRRQSTPPRYDESA
jgi:hypothetical protein